MLKLTFAGGTGSVTGANFYWKENKKIFNRLRACAGQKQLKRQIESICI